MKHIIENGAIVLAVENGETGIMETWDEDTAKRPGYSLLKFWASDGTPLFPGDPDRHDAGAGDRVDYLVQVKS